MIQTGLGQKIVSHHRGGMSRLIRWTRKYMEGKPERKGERKTYDETEDEQFLP